MVWLLLLLVAGLTSDLMARRSLKRRSWDEFMPQGTAVRAGIDGRAERESDLGLRPREPRQLG